MAGKEGNPNAGPYSATKAGVIDLTKSLGKELTDNDLTRGVHGVLLKFWLILPAVMRASFQFLKECKFKFF